MRLVLGKDSFEFPLPDRTALYGNPAWARVCPVCLSTWAILETAETESYRVIQSLCSACPPPFGDWSHVDMLQDPIPGSLLSRPDRLGYPVDWHLFDALPEALVRRELNLTLKAIVVPQL